MNEYRKTRLSEISLSISTLSPDQLRKVDEFIGSFENAPVLDENFPYEELMRYLFMGWYVYQAIDRS